MSPRILIADDNAAFREMVTAWLNDAGMDVCAVADGVEALSMLDSAFRGHDRIPALVLTDLNMPGVNGLDIVAAVSQRSHELPVIVLTAWRDGQALQMAWHLGAARVLHKSISRSSLMATIRELLRE